MLKYSEMKQKQQNEINNFPMVFAFSNKQFAEAMAKLGLTENDTDKIYSIGGGGFIRKTDSEKLHEMSKRHQVEMDAAMQDAEFAFTAFDYELANHEHIITWDVSDTLSALGLTMEEVNNNPILKEALKKAIKAQQNYNQ